MFCSGAGAVAGGGGRGVRWWGRVPRKARPMAKSEEVAPPERPIIIGRFTWPTLMLIPPVVTDRPVGFAVPGRAAAVPAAVPAAKPPASHLTRTTDELFIDRPLLDATGPLSFLWFSFSYLAPRF